LGTRQIWNAKEGFEHENERKMLERKAEVKMGTSG
jgi:hypothetical protein